MSLGLAEAARAVGMRAKVRLVIDLDASAVEICQRSFPGCRGLSTPVEELIDGKLGSKTTSTEREFLKKLDAIDVLVGGPPCQGHSDLNNHTRRNDKRNALALRMVRFAELTRPKHIIIENVRGIVHDRRKVLQRAETHLQSLGYQTKKALLRAEDFGVPQLRRRVLMVATRSAEVHIPSVLDLPRSRVRDFAWACGDLPQPGQGDHLHIPPSPNATNQARIDYLFDEKLWELPDSERPQCHRNGSHSYKSIYGRLHWDRPAQTITTGFRSMGQGRFVHPRERRTITPREAARLQFIPDFVDFAGLKPTVVAKLIGNAVPPKLTFGIGVNLLAPDCN